MNCKLFLAIAILLALNSCAARDKVDSALNKIDQNASHYVPQKSFFNLSKEQNKNLKLNFENKYFMPWQEPSPATLKNVLKILQIETKLFSKQPGWGVNFHPISEKYIHELVTNADISHYPNINQPGIIVHHSMVRALPTPLPSYANPFKAGSGYPFDSFQNSFIAQGTPIRILQQTKDGLWYLIITPSYHGWIPNQDVGRVSKELMAQWRKNSFLIALKDNIALQTEDKRGISYTRIGTLYPKVSEDHQAYKILVPLLDEQGNAKIKIARVNKTDMRPFPLPLNEKIMADIANQMLGTPYGWGGMYEQRDCSATTQDLFANFGIYLPRSSTAQAKTGTHTSLAGKTPQEKLQQIKTKAVPFFTLIHFPGHIALYLGTKNEEVYILQDKWGLETRNLWGEEGRAIIGKTVITPIDFGKEFINVKRTLLDTADGFTILPLPKPSVSE